MSRPLAATNKFVPTLQTLDENRPASFANEPYPLRPLQPAAPRFDHLHAPLMAATSRTPSRTPLSADQINAITAESSSFSGALRTGVEWGAFTTATGLICKRWLPRTPKIAALAGLGFAAGVISSAIDQYLVSEIAHHLLEEDESETQEKL